MVVCTLLYPIGMILKEASKPLVTSPRAGIDTMPMLRECTFMRMSTDNDAEII